MQEYVPGTRTSDTVGRRMSFTHKKLSKWYIQATAQGNLKKLRRINKLAPLNCENVVLETEIGTEPSQGRKKTRFQPYEKRGGRRKSFRRPPQTRWSRQKARSYKSGQRSGPAKGGYSAKKTFRRAQARTNESFKDCNCWTCGAKGHISIDCPDNKRKGIKKFESTPDIEEAIYRQKLVPVFQFEEIFFDESIFEQEEYDESSSSEESDMINRSSESDSI